QGYRPAALSVLAGGPAPPRPGGGERGRGEGLVTASVWHRPTIAEDDKEKLAKRQANAAVVLLRLGQADKVWPLLKHSRDCRARRPGSCGTGTSRRNCRRSTSNWPRTKKPGWSV